jgi:hypothetical protein
LRQRLDPGKLAFPTQSWTLSTGRTEPPTQAQRYAEQSEPLCALPERIRASGLASRSRSEPSSVGLLICTKLVDGFADAFRFGLSRQVGRAITDSWGSSRPCSPLRFEVEPRYRHDRCERSPPRLTPESGDGTAREQAGVLAGTAGRAIKPLRPRMNAASWCLVGPYRARRLPWVDPPAAQLFPRKTVQPRAHV